MTKQVSINFPKLSCRRNQGIVVQGFGEGLEGRHRVTVQVEVELATCRGAVPSRSPAWTLGPKQRLQTASRWEAWAWESAGHALHWAALPLPHFPLDSQIAPTPRAIPNSPGRPSSFPRLFSHSLSSNSFLPSSRSRVGQGHWQPQGPTARHSPGPAS